MRKSFLSVCALFVLGAASACVLAQSDAQTQPLSDAQIRKLGELLPTHGHDITLDASISGALGLAAPGQALTVHQLTTNPANQIRHAYQVLPDGGYLLMTGSQTSVRSYRANARQELVAAVDSAANKPPAAIPAAEAQREIKAEFAYWAGIADHFLHAERMAEPEWVSCLAQLGGAKAVSADLKIAGCNAVIESGKESPRDMSIAYVNRSRGYAAKLDKEQQLRDLDQAVKIDPTSAFAWASSCSAHTWVSHDTDRAMKECSTAIKLDPKASASWTYRGDIYLNLHDYDRAIEDYNHAIELEPTWMWPWDNRGEAYMRSNRIERAMQDFAQVIKLSPDYAMGHIDLGKAHIKLHQLDLAQADFEAGLKVDPKSASPLYGRGIVKVMKGDAAGGKADIAAAEAMRAEVAKSFEDDGISVP